jgi:hypothetical protein
MRWNPNNPYDIEDGEKRWEAMAEWFEAQLLDAPLKKRSRWRSILFSAAHILAGLWMALSSALLGYTILRHFGLASLWDWPVILLLFSLTGLYLYRQR